MGRPSWRPRSHDRNRYTDWIVLLRLSDPAHIRLPRGGILILCNGTISPPKSRYSVLCLLTVNAVEAEISNPLPPLRAMRAAPFIFVHDQRPH